MSEILLGGVKEDFEDLVYKFSLVKSCTFKDFIEIWNEMEFYYIFSGRKSLEEMKFFVGHALLIAKDLILRYTTDFDKAGALFLLHAIYFSQPLEIPVEIRIEHDELKDLISFVDHMKAVTLDVPYAFMKLVVKDAFHFVYNYLPRTAEKYGKADVRNLAKLQEETDSQVERLNLMEMIKDANFNEDIWRSEENNYNNMMKRLSEMKITQKELKFESHDFFKDVLFPVKPTKTEEKRNRKFQPKKPKLMKLLNDGLDIELTEKEFPAVESSKSLPVIGSHFNNKSDSSENDSDWEQ